MYKFVSDSFSNGDVSRCIVSLIGLPEHLEFFSKFYFELFSTLGLLSFFMCAVTTHFIDVKMTECGTGEKC